MSDLQNDDKILALDLKIANPKNYFGNTLKRKQILPPSIQLKIDPKFTLSSVISNFNLSLNFHYANHLTNHSTSPIQF
jgi:hypothetical protein